VATGSIECGAGGQARQEHRRQVCAQECLPAVFGIRPRTSYEDCVIGAVGSYLWQAEGGRAQMIEAPRDGAAVVSERRRWR
jgi:hypothetical protein